MAEKVNETHQSINELLKNIEDNKQLALKIAEKDYWTEVQLSKDYELIKERVLAVVNSMNRNNLELRKVEIESIFLVVQKQFEQRKIEALKGYRHTKERM